ncbi:MAG: protein kinase [Alistipes sp.]|nr:protein kinase [Alistipes sp.]
MTQQEFTERYRYDASLDLLGEGGFGRVYRAYDSYEHEYVALKMQVVNPAQPDLRLREEVEKVQQYHHRYIARYKDCYTFSTLNGEMDVAVMKYYQDGSLDKLIKSGKLSNEARYDLLLHILEGIAFLHSNGIIHRDLKPQNILIVEHNGEYTPLITDFGISKQIVQGENSAISTSLYGGTYSYVSPEQLKETTIRKNTDLWSFGIIAFQFLTGTYPFNCGSYSPTSQDGRQEQFRQMTSGNLPQEISNIAEPWQTLIRKCLVVDNNERIAHAEDAIIIVTSGEVVEATPVKTATPVGATPIEAAPVETAPVETAPVEAAPVETVAAAPIQQSAQSTPVEDAPLFNKLYRKYAIGTIISVAIFFLCSFIVSIYRNFSPVHIYGFGADPLDIFFVLTYLIVAIVGCGALVFTAISLKGFARVQKNQENKGAVRLLSWSAIVGAVANAMGYVSLWRYYEYYSYPFEDSPKDSDFPIIWLVFTALVFFTGVIMAIVGLAKLKNSNSKSANLLSGLSLTQIFVFIVAGISAMQYIIRAVNISDYDEDWATIIFVLELFKFLSLVIPIIGAVKFIKHREEVTEEEYEAIYQANEEKRSVANSTKAWYYCLGGIFALFSLKALFYHLYSFISNVRWDYELPDFDYDKYSIWYKMYCSVLGNDAGLIALFCIVTLALSVWLLTRQQVRNVKYMNKSLLLMGISALILPVTLLFLGTLYYLDVEPDGFIGDVLMALFYLGWLNILLYISIFVFVLNSRINNGLKIIIGLLLVPVIFGIIFTWLQYVGHDFDIKWVYKLAQKDFMETFWTIQTISYALVTGLFFIAAAFAAPCKSKGWIKWIVMSIALLFVTLYTYSYFQIDKMDKEAKAWVEANKYEIGDFYNKDGIKGIVIEVDYQSRATKLLSLEESSEQWDNSLYWSDYWYEYRGGSYTYANNSYDGQSNMRTIMNRSDSNKFSAFNWCKRRGSGWYLPAKYELTELSDNLSAINTTLRREGYTTISGNYWSSTEDDSCDAYYVNVNNESCRYSNKNSTYLVRAMYRIHADDAISSITEIAVPVEEAVASESTTETTDYYYEDDYYEEVECAPAADYDEDDYWY